MDDRTLGEYVSDVVSRFGGSWKFIFIFSGFLAVWIAFNTYSAIAFDKPPYILLNLILSFIAAFQAPFIMMSQNRAEKKQDASYRMLFKELKEMLQFDIEKEHEIERLSQEIKENQVADHERHKILSGLLLQTNQEHATNRKILERLIQICDGR